jgi:uncharacterized membrane protein
VPTLYEALLFAHILGAVVWIGGAAMHVALVALAKRSGNREDVVKLVGWDDRLGLPVYVPAALLVLLAGIGLVEEGGWGWDQPWVIAGLVLIGVAIIGGAAFYIPTGRRIQEAVAEEGPGSERAARLIDNLERVARLELLLFATAIYVMTAKPGL